MSVWTLVTYRHLLCHGNNMIRLGSNMLLGRIACAGVASSAASSMQSPAGGRASHPHPAVAASASTQALGLALRHMLTAL